MVTFPVMHVMSLMVSEEDDFRFIDYLVLVL